MKEIYEHFKNKKEQGIFQDEDRLRTKSLGGDPATSERPKCWKESKAKGPVGFLLESMRLQAAGMDEDFAMRQTNQAPVDIAMSTLQQLPAQVRQIATRNRTMRAEGMRD